MDISVRLFGLNPWSVLVPQALEGVAAVALLYAAVRRVSGPAGGAAGRRGPRADSGRRADVPLQQSRRAAGAAAGRGRLLRAARLRKGQQPLVVGRRGRGGRASASWPRCCRPSWCCRDSAPRIPGGGAVARCGTRLLRLWSAASRRWWCPAGGICCSSSCGRASSRPYIGGSQHDSIVELALGYNGFGRLTGDETGGLGNMNFDVGWARLFGSGMGADIAWLLPAAVICLGAGSAASPGGHRAPTDPRGAVPLGRLAAGHRRGVQLHERHRAPLLHGGAGPCDRRVHRHRRNAVVAQPLRHPGRDSAVGHRSRHARSWRACCCSRRRAGCPGCGRRSPSGEWRPRRCCSWSAG